MVKTCTNCRYDRDGIPDMYCHGCYNHSKHELIPQTNADRIRAMSDEELAKVISIKFCHGKLYQWILNWLKLEVKE